MTRTSLNFLLDSALLVAFLGLIWTATVVRFVFPPGPEAHGWRLWGMGYDRWSTIQYATISLLACGNLGISRVIVNIRTSDTDHSGAREGLPLASNRSQFCSSSCNERQTHAICPFHRSVAHRNAIWSRLRAAS